MQLINLMIITLKRRIRQGVFLMAATVLLTGCELFEFSPNDVRAPAADRDLTAKNLARLQATPKPTGGDTLRFVFTGDFPAVFTMKVGRWWKA